MYVIIKIYKYHRRVIQYVNKTINTGKQLASQWAVKERKLQNLNVTIYD